MGLTIAVGLLAQAKREDEEEFAGYAQGFDLLNDVLGEAGMEPHHEPLDVPEPFEAQMWGYGGLHAVRRLAAYRALKGRLPPPGRYEDYAEDPVTERLNERLRSYHFGWRGMVAMWLYWSPPRPRFEHLLWHSDCEGFYLPRDFTDVVLDQATPQRAGVGGMVGSSVRLLHECTELAEWIGLPGDIDEESDAMWENAENPPAEGEAWQVYGVEAFGLARLIRGCEHSIRHGAALVFG